MIAINRFGSVQKTEIAERTNLGIPCVFVSHSSSDKAKARRIADYILANGLDVYFDQDDIVLQRALGAGDSAKIVACIIDGLRNCTHALCVVSQSVVRSQWVPYELGYAKSLSRPLASLMLSEVDKLPEFYSVEKVLPDMYDFEKYIQSLRTGRAALLVEKKAYNIPDLTDIVARVRTANFF